jgi:hypothetical protein
MENVDFTITGQAPILTYKYQTRVEVTDSNNTTADSCWQLLQYGKWQMFYSNGSGNFTLKGQAPFIARKYQTRVRVT